MKDLINASKLLMFEITYFNTSILHEFYYVQLHSIIKNSDLPFRKEIKKSHVTTVQDFTFNPLS
jgi:hypothetical protein